MVARSFLGVDFGCARREGKGYCNWGDFRELLLM